MNRFVWSSLWVTPALLGAAALSATASTPTPAVEVPATSANPVLERVEDYRNQNPALANPLYRPAEGLKQVTSVSQLTDVRPTDWAFQALQSLVERYGCIVGYPDKTYRGNQALSRYEFAAGLNSCLDRVNELIAAGTADLVKKEDLLALQRLQEEFAAELASLRGEVGALEARTTSLERQNFSATTKLSGEVLFNISDTLGDSAREVGSQGARRLPTTPAASRGISRFIGGSRTATVRDDRTEPVFSNRVRLSLDSSFYGTDRLRVRLQARNIVPYAGNALTGTNMTRLGYDGDEGNAIIIDKLNYRFPLGENLRIQFDATNTEFTGDSLVTTLSPFESSGLGALSRFGRYNAFYRNGNPGTPGSGGLSAAYKFNDKLRFEFAYVGDPSSNDPTKTISGTTASLNGIFGASFSALGQVVLTSGKLSASLGYARTYFTRADGANLTGSLGSAFASNPFNSNAATNRVATVADSIGANVQYKLSPGMIVGAWYSAWFAHQLNSTNDARIQTGAVYLALPDFLKEGNLAGLLVGIPPKATRNDFRASGTRTREDNDSTAIHIEAFYRYRLNDNIAITPGVFAIIHPEHNSANATQYVGAIRTTFSF